MAEASEQRHAPSTTAKLVLELGPLFVFFAANYIGGLFVATGALIAATLVSLVASRIMHGTIPIMPLVTAGIVAFFGGLTLYLHDETFIKVKPTIVYVTFAAVLLGGLFSKKPLLEHVLGQVFQLTEEGWRKLSYRWAAFFLAMAVLNELVWRNVSTDQWVAFKAFGLLPLTVLFAMLQAGLLARHELADPKVSVRQNSAPDD